MCPIYKSKEEVFETVVRALANQGCRSAEIGSCRYRTEDGRKCAIGHLIPDDVYQKSMENNAFFKILGTSSRNDSFRQWYIDSGIRSICVRDEGSLLMSLQRVHDNPITWLSRRDFIFAFSDISKQFSIPFDWESVNFSSKLC